MTASNQGLSRAAGQNDMADAVAAAQLDQLEQVGVHGDEVDAERAAGPDLLARINASGHPVRHCHAHEADLLGGQRTDAAALAGIVEGFVTPQPWPWAVKIGIGTLALGVFLALAGIGGAVMLHRAFARRTIRVAWIHSDGTVALRGVHSLAAKAAVASDGS